MMKCMTLVVVATGILLGPVSAEAGGRYHSHHRGHHHGHYGNIGGDILIGAGIIGGAILLGSLLTRPYYPPPPPVAYVPPRPRYCVQDRVYRYLPDGRIQWGTRTTCY